MEFLRLARTIRYRDGETEPSIFRPGVAVIIDSPLRLRFCDRLRIKMNRDAERRDPRQTLTSDKIRAKALAQNLGLAVPQTYAIAERAEEVMRLDLPATCVVKPNHLSGEVFLLRDGAVQSTRGPRTFDDVRREAGRWLGRNYALERRMPATFPEPLGLPWLRYEWCYENIEPRVIVEEQLWHRGNDWLPTELKVFCFHGRARMIEVTVDRYREGLHAWMAPDWSRLPIRRVNQANQGSPIPRPAHIDRTIAAAEAIASPFDFVRVDFLEVGTDEPYFGEITHFPAAGGLFFDPEEWNYTIGDWMEVSETVVCA